MTNNADKDVNFRFQLILLISGPVDKPLVSVNIIQFRHAFTTGYILLIT